MPLTGNRGRDVLVEPSPRSRTPWLPGLVPPLPTGKGRRARAVPSRACAEPSRARAVPAPGRASSAAREEAARSIGGARAGMAAPGALEPASGSVPGTKVELTVSCR